VQCIGDSTKFILPLSGKPRKRQSCRRARLIHEVIPLAPLLSCVTFVI